MRDLAEPHDTWEELPVAETLLHPGFRPASQVREAAHVACMCHHRKRNPKGPDIQCSK